MANHSTAVYACKNCRAHLFVENRAQIEPIYHLHHPVSYQVNNEITHNIHYVATKMYCDLCGTFLGTFTDSHDLFGWYFVVIVHVHI